MSAIAYYILQQVIIASQGPDSVLRRAIGGDWKGKASPILYVLGVLSAFLSPWIAQAIYVAVALIWLIPDSRIERTVAPSGAASATLPANLHPPSRPEDHPRVEGRR